LIFNSVHGRLDDSPQPFSDTNGFGAGYVSLDKNGDAVTPALTQIPSGPHSITAAYSGDNSFNSSVDSSPINFTISKVATTTVLTVQQSPQSLQLTATVSASSSGSPPSGLITFSNGSTVLTTAFLGNGTTSNGSAQSTATFDGTQLPPGQYVLSASYPGDTNFLVSNSAATTLNLIADFTVADRGITSQTVTAGQTASYVNDIGVTPFSGFSSTVALSCTVPAQATTCSVNPTSLSTAAGPNIASVMVTTKSRTSAAFWKPLETDPPPFNLPPWAAAAGILLGMTLWGRSLTRQRWQARIFALFVLSMVFAIGCGGGSTPITPPPPLPNSGTPVGTYTIVVTGTASTSTGTVTHTTNLALVVQ